MQKWVLSIAMMLSVSGLYAQDDYNARVQQYIEQYKGLAVAEQKRSGIPAAITLAQGIHETAAGNSELATNANNHFGIKCKKGWQGLTYAYTDDAPNECFRKYTSPDISYKDHSDYLRTNPRYAKLFTLSVTDYAGWAIGLRQCGYATNPAYAAKLIKLIEDYKLQEYTYYAMNNELLSEAYAGEVIPEHDAQPTATQMPAEVPAPVVAAAPTSPAIAEKAASLAAARNMQIQEEAPQQQTEHQPIAQSKPQKKYKSSSNIVVNESIGPDPIDLSKDLPQYGKVTEVHGLRAIYAKKGESPLEIAYKNSIRYARLLEFNDMEDRPLPADMYIYLEKKNTRGQKPLHMVKPGETLLMVAQEEGMQVKALRELNHLKPGEEPVPGTTLELQQLAAAKPRVYTKDIAQEAPAARPARQYEYVSTDNSNATAQHAPAPAVATTPKVVAAPSPAAVAIDVPAAVQIKEEEPVETVQTAPVVAKEVLAQQAVVKQEEVAVKEEPAEVIVAEVEETPVVEQKQEAAPITAAFKEEVVTIPLEEPKEEPVPEPEVVAANEPASTDNLPAPSATPPVKEEPQDELSQLKAQFDRVIYADEEPEAAPAPKPESSKAPVTPSKPVAAKEQVAMNTAASAEKFYTVKKGDTAYGIAKRHNISMRDLMEWNELDFNAIKVGQKLRVKP